MNKLTWGDSGLRNGADNIVLDSQQIIVTRTDHMPLLRFYESTQTVALGANEDARFAVRSTYCQTRSIPIVRRLTGGGTSYLYHKQISLSLTLPAQHLSIEQWLDTICMAVCCGLYNSGYENINFKRPNDIYENGQKLGSVYVGVLDNVLIANATLYRSLDINTMLRALRVPKEKLTPEGMRTASHHFTTLPSLSSADLLHLKESLAQSIALSCNLPTLMQIPWVNTTSQTYLCDHNNLTENAHEITYSGFTITSGGVLHGRIQLDTNIRISSLHLNGNVYIRPYNLFRKIESVLRGAAEGEIMQRMDNLLYENPWELYRFTPQDIMVLLRRLFEQHRIAAKLSIAPSAASSFMIHDPDGTLDAFDIAAKADTVLVPYCAKPTWCKWRHNDGCSQCGKCDVGQVYKIAREQELQVTTINNFEHLEITLKALNERGTKAYLGMCCNNFYIKREYAFRSANMPALLLDISGANCYDLMQEQSAYSGEFSAESSIDIEVAEKVIKLVRPESLQ
ncbi:lipoate--protein ligase [Acidithiobacillus ferrivorans]|uniref:Lipoate--protein ligase n=2 Tax=Acidithiobacillus ferrivorans TaxID=160808 RepID=A0A1B9BZ03_9PROT|nr:lipoate--protein ligase [Acidithiobacillus ferrivorans]